MGFSEMLLVMVVAFIILGPQKLLEISRSLGKAVREYKKAMNEIDEDVVEVEITPSYKKAKTTPADNSEGRGNEHGTDTPTSI